MRTAHASQDKFIHKGSDHLVITSSKGSTLPILENIEGKEEDREYIVYLRLSNVSFSAS